MTLVVARDTTDLESHIQELRGLLLAAGTATMAVGGYEEFKAKLEDPGGFLLAHWCGRGECEELIQQETRATIRCITFDQPKEHGRCVRCDGDSEKRVHFARAY